MKNSLLNIEFSDLKFQDWDVVHDPKDKALLRPLNALGKASTSTQSGVNFLRKSEGGANANIFHKQKKGFWVRSLGRHGKIDKQTQKRRIPRPFFVMSSKGSTLQTRKMHTKARTRRITFGEQIFHARRRRPGSDRGTQCNQSSSYLRATRSCQTFRLSQTLVGT